MTTPTDTRSDRYARDLAHEGKIRRLDSEQKQLHFETRESIMVEQFVARDIVDG